VNRPYHGGFIYFKNTICKPTLRRGELRFARHHANEPELTSTRNPVSLAGEPQSAPTMGDLFISRIQSVNAPCVGANCGSPATKVNEPELTSTRNPVSLAGEPQSAPTMGDLFISRIQSVNPPCVGANCGSPATTRMNRN
jgi:hypothetical protein